ncbi:MAG: metal-dependent transcriptional regulator [Actinomycetaceae bacterium]|nr:metal-dependent transcriptional regulator [Actinomycetaceae bacterium]MDY5854720.1 metal-dependent transcriptional regulator [Arcanobacterium sp.]
MGGELIDTTEMYLKTVYELEEEGVPALRARIVERLGQSGPTVSETVARLERDGLLRIGAGRQIQFTDEGFCRAEAVMRRHRLAERLLLDVINLDWAHVHDEACRWEHVVSDAVADKIDDLLKNPQTDPFGNPIPQVHGRECTKESSGFPDGAVAGLKSLADIADAKEVRSYEVARFSERVQSDPHDLVEFEAAGVRPRAVITVHGRRGDDVVIVVNDAELLVPAYIAEGVYIYS